MQPFEITNLYLSSGHNYFGHHGKRAGVHQMIEVDELSCVHGLGVEGDRFFNYKPAYKGQITFFERETYDSLCREFAVKHRPPAAFRRNVITRGVALIELIGKNFSIGGVQFAGIEECRPCYWMDEAFFPGAERSLRGRGGLRAMILSSGKLRLGVYQLGNGANANLTG